MNIYSMIYVFLSNSYLNYIIQHQNILNLGVKIVNAEDLRVLPAGYNDSMFDQHQDVFWEVDRTKIRTIFLISMIDEAFHIAKGFKRIGLRTGDLIPFFSFLVSLNSPREELFFFLFFSRFGFPGLPTRRIAV